MSFLQQLKNDINPFDGPKAGAVKDGSVNINFAGQAPNVPTVKPSVYNPNSDIDALNKQIAAEQAQYQALQAQQAAQPKLPVYNTAAAYANAQKAATSAVDPVYQDKLSQYLQQEQLTTAQNTTAEQNAEADAASTLSNQTTDNATNRTRTAADEVTNTGDVNQNETNVQADTGTAFDRARTALLGGVANAGLTTSGIGSQKAGQAIADRNQSEGEQTQSFDNSRRDIHTAATRTFEDLATSDTRNTSAAATTTARAKQGLQDYIDNAALGEQSFRTQNEQERQGAIESATNSQYQQGVQQFIASLIGSGARAQDVALASQVYG
jgi:hypothetical protein